ncbi:hypothetical protein EC957_000923 [Mortierella hygrophila]|uniref:Phosphatidylglycerol/phosphatidylinositol transfer protein n=1 Tax=Mortierella hygrophila TaxID=979708 RepID=A0A9P6F679_9FUNG|nr:hypothetical protein EC957_000923 [Mortierella hygrophila]
MKFTTILASAAALLAVTSQATALDWTNCANPSSQVPDATFKMDGEWACIGEKVCGTLTGTFEKPIIQGAKLDIIVRYLNKITSTFNADLCTVLAESGYNCPIAAGPKTLHACVKYNGTIVNVPGSTTVSARNGDGNTLFCQASVVTNQNCPATPNP